MTFAIYMRPRPTSTRAEFTHIADVDLPDEVADFDVEPWTEEEKIVLGALNKFKEQIPEDSTAILARELPDGRLDIIAECYL